MLKSQFPILPILPNKSQFQNPKNKFGIWDFGFILDLVVFVFGIYLGFCILCSNVYALNLDKVKVHFLEGDYKSAILEGEKILAGADRSSHSDELYYILGLSYLQNGNYLRASDIFEIIIKEFKYSAFKDEALLGLGDIYFLERDYAQAQEYYKELINTRPYTKFRASVYYRLSQVEFKKGSMQQAREYLDRLKKEFPLSLEARLDSRQLSSLLDPYYSVQVGSFLNRMNAQSLMQKLVQQGYTAYIEEASSKAKITYRVRVGKFRNLQEAVELEDRLTLEGYPTRIYP